MFNDLKIIQLASAMARHAVARNNVVAENITNANTPGFKAREVEPFSEYIKHLNQNNGAREANKFRIRESDGFGVTSPNGNTVSIEQQMMHGAKASGDHKTAIAIYSKTLDLLKLSLRGRR